MRCACDDSDDKFCNFPLQEIIYPETKCFPLYKSQYIYRHYRHSGKNDIRKHTIYVSQMIHLDIKKIHLDNVNSIERFLAIIFVTAKGISLNVLRRTLPCRIVGTEDRQRKPAHASARLYIIRYIDTHCADVPLSSARCDVKSLRSSWLTTTDVRKRLSHI